MLLIVMMALTYLLMDRAKRGKVPSVRKLAALDALKEAVGRATEMGKPIVFVPGSRPVSTWEGPQQIAGIGVLSYVADLCADYRAQLIVAIMQPDVYPLAYDTVRGSYLKAAKPQDFKSENVRFISSSQFAFVFGLIGDMYREKAAAAVYMGTFFGETPFYVEGGAALGAITIAGTANVNQIAIFAMGSDAFLMGEELFAAGAHLTKDPDMLASLLAQDVIKIAAIVVVIVGFLVKGLRVYDFVKLLVW